MVMSAVLVMIMSLVLLLPIASYALIPRIYPVVRTAPIGGGSIGSSGGSSGSYSGYHGPIYQPQAVVTEYSNGVVIQSTGSGAVGHGGVHVPVRATTTSGQSTPTMSTKEVITITKTYTQTIYYTTVINNIITKYMMPIIKYEFTLVNIGQYQEAGYHMVGSEKLFLPGSGSGGIFVPVYAQEAVYAYNIAPTTKPQITGWYVGSQSQSTSTSTIRSVTPPQLSSVQDAVDNAQQAVNAINQLATTNSNGLGSTTYVYYSSSTTLFNTNTQVITKPYPYTPPPFYYSQQDINNAYSTAWNDLTHGDVLGAIYNVGRGAYMQSWNTLAGAVYSAYQFVQVASNAFNTATLAKNIGLALNVLNPFNW
jgi:hypothetical protein